ncbi:MAG: cytochrome c maturation protein CcmE [Rhodobacteraceae bacterium]|nr:cytochrome c maturation protein CcmE [Paracoccaceae bacterium]
MTRKTRRLYFVALGLLAVAAGVGLMLSAVSDNVTFFASPSDLKTKSLTANQRLRLGGLVEEGSVARDGNTVKFIVTDTAERVNVSYAGILPDLFREGQGVVAEGHLAPDGVFVADDVLAKHDENYMPREVAEALKESGHWQEGGDPNAAPDIAVRETATP